MAADRDWDGLDLEFLTYDGDAISLGSQSTYIRPTPSSQEPPDGPEYMSLVGLR